MSGKNPFDQKPWPNILVNLGEKCNIEYGSFQEMTVEGENLWLFSG